MMQSGRWLLVLLGLFGILSVALGEEATVTNSTAPPTDGKGDGEEGDDDGAFDVKDLLPGFEETKNTNFVSNYIMGDPQYYTEVYDPVSTKRRRMQFFHMIVVMKLTQNSCPVSICI
jgi:hypothetical protein